MLPVITSLLLLACTGTPAPGSSGEDSDAEDTEGPLSWDTGFFDEPAEAAAPQHTGEDLSELLLEALEPNATTCRLARELAATPVLEGLLERREGGLQGLADLGV